jgi:hypothetical protein
MRSTIEVLKAARNLIKDPARWTKHVYARTAEGAETKVRAKDAACFCAYGAVCHVLGVGVWARGTRKAKLRDAAYRRLNQEAIKIVGKPRPHVNGGIYQANDDLGHGPTLKIFNRVIRDLAR